MANAIGLRATLLVVAVLSATSASLWTESSPSLSAARPPSQSSEQDWQRAAGGRMAFDSASIQKNTTAPPRAQFFNFPIGPGDVYMPHVENFRTRNLPLVDYILFAYKITPNQENFLFSQLPAWAMEDRFDIDAKAAGEPTKDQMRLMVQSLLADRFKLSAHFEAREVPVLALLVDQPGQLGPLLQRHPEDSPCPTVSFVPSPPPTAPPQALDNRFPTACGGILAMVPSAPGRVRGGARNVPMDLIASSMAGSQTGTDRPVVDRTDLTGRFDFAIEFVPQGSPSAQTSSPSDSSGPTFATALKEQLGLRLVPQTTPLNFLVIDLIDQLSPN